MDIFFNDTPLTVDGIDDETSIADLIELVQQEVGKNGLTVVDVELDGTKFTADDAQLKTSRAGECRSLHLLGATIAELVSQALEDREAVFQHVEKLGRSVSESLRIGKVPDAMKQHVELLEGLTWITSILGNLGNAFPEKMAETDLELRRHELMTRLGEQMTALHEIQEKQDWVGMADLLEYELPEILQVGQDFLARFSH